MYDDFKVETFDLDIPLAVIERMRWRIVLNEDGAHDTPGFTCVGHSRGVHIDGGYTPRYLLLVRTEDLEAYLASFTTAAPLTHNPFAGLLGAP